MLIFEDTKMFRERLISSLISNKPIIMKNIRSESASSPGLQDFEANFLRLIEKLTEGSEVEINDTGTKVTFQPGPLIGGEIQHDCCLSRGLGWYIEAMLPLAPFCKLPMNMSLTGITNNDIDISIDVITNITLPLLQNFGIYNSRLVMTRRGSPPNGGGHVHLLVPNVRTNLKSIFMVEEGLVKRIRGVAFSSHVSPTFTGRAVEACREVLNNFLPDVQVHVDASGGLTAGKSPGYAISLFAESNTGALMSTERCVCAKTQVGDAIELFFPANDSRFVPEEVGRQCAHGLLHEILSGGAVDSVHQSLVLLLMAFTSEDVSKVKFGELSSHAIDTMRLIRVVFGTIFKIREDHNSRFGQPSLCRTTYLLSCLGLGCVNRQRKST